MTGGMDNPVDVAFTPGGRTHPHRDLPRTSAGGQAGRDRPCRLRRRVRQAAQRPRRPQADRRSDAGHVPARPGGAGRPHALRIGRVRRRLSRQLLRRDVQSAKGHAAHPDAERFDVHDPRRGLPRLRRSRLPSDRRHRGRRRQPARRRHRALVQAVLPDVAAREAGRARRDLPDPPHRRGEAARSEGADARLAIDERRSSRRDARRSAAGGAEQGRAAAAASRGRGGTGDRARASRARRPRTRAGTRCGRSPASTARRRATRIGSR